VHGSAAEQLEYNVYEENKILKEKKKQRSNTKAKFKAVVFLAVVAAMFLAVVLRYAILTEHTYNIQMHNTELKEVINQNLKLSIEIENNMDLHKIREVAEKKLGMQIPDKSQIVHIKVPKSDFTEVSTSSHADGKSVRMIDRLVDKFTSLVYLIS